MKRTPAILICLLMLARIYASDWKVALIVAISNYPEGSGWQALHAHNDVELMRQALMSRGFAGEDILVLQDEQATRQGILDAFQRHLIARARPGGVALFHFSGHGQQMEDHSGDEFDRYDEALVPYDSPQAYEAGKYEGQRLLRDEELGLLLRRLRQRLGPDGEAVATLDACHSGTGTRGRGTARGTHLEMASQGFQEQESRRFGTGEGLLDESGAEAQLAPLVAFYGASARELNYETVTAEGLACGSLSYALSQAIQQAPPSASYATLFDKVRLVMAVHAPLQTPRAEGPLHRAVLGGGFLPGIPHHTLTRVVDERTAYLDAGSLAGLFLGTRVAFYPPDTRDTSGRQPLAVGQINYTSLFGSEVVLEKGVAGEDAVGWWAVVTKASLGADPLLVEPSGMLDRGLLDQLGQLPGIQLAARPGQLFLSENGGNLNLSTKEGVSLWSGKVAPGTLPEGLTAALNAYQKARFLRGVDLQDPFLKVSMEIDTDNGENRAASQNLRLKPGDVFTIRVTNHGTHPAYFCILDIQPDHQMNPIIPYPGDNRTSEDFYILPGQTRELGYDMVVGPPYGREVLKLIATDKPLGLERYHRGPTRGQVQDDFYGWLHEFLQPEEETSN
ncbi:MAG: caspase family protein [Lewinellaceae bacterium]|nr:caspase family protein [Lewinellaceae bacterium]